MCYVAISRVVVSVFIFTPIHGEMIKFDKYLLNGLKPSTRFVVWALLSFLFIIKFKYFFGFTLKKG